jgi:selenocysteine lyase/cysteine desulfurase
VRGDARRFESWEANMAARAGLRVAAAYARAWGLDAIEARVVALAAGLRDRLAAVPGVVVQDRGERRCGIVTFTHAEVQAEEVQRKLAAAGVNVAVSSPSSTLLDAEQRRLPPLVRASVHYLTTEAELDLATATVASL